MNKTEIEKIEKIKEERREEIRRQMRRDGTTIGVVVVKTNHNKDCGCVDCLTIPDPFCPFPVEHRRFVDALRAVKSSEAQ